jgi:hypothetical protein
MGHGGGIGHVRDAAFEMLHDAEEGTQSSPHRLVTRYHHRKGMTRE